MKKVNEIITGKIVEVEKTHITIRYDNKDFKITGHFQKAVTGITINLIMLNREGFEYFVPTLEDLDKLGGKTSLLSAIVKAKKRTFSLFELENGETIFWNSSKKLTEGQKINVLTAKFAHGIHPYMIEQ